MIKVVSQEQVWQTLGADSNVRFVLSSQEMQFQEQKKGEKQKSEYFQTQWRKHVDKLTIPPKQTPVYLAVSKGPSKEKKHRTGEDSKHAGTFIFNKKIKEKHAASFIHFFYLLYSYRVG